MCAAVHPLLIVPIDFDAEPETRWTHALDIVMENHGWEYSFGPLFKHHNKTDFKILSDDQFLRIGNSLKNNYPVFAREL